MHTHLSISFVIEHAVLLKTRHHGGVVTHYWGRMKLQVARIISNPFRTFKPNRTTRFSIHRNPLRLQIKVFKKTLLYPTAFHLQNTQRPRDRSTHDPEETLAAQMM